MTNINTIAGAYAAVLVICFDASSSHREAPSNVDGTTHASLIVAVKP
jgi:hypothetical protein